MLALLPYPLNQLGITVEQTGWVVFVLALITVSWLMVRYRHLLFRGVPEISAEALGMFRIFYGLAMIMALNFYDQRSSLTAPRDYPWWGSWHILDDFATSAGAVHTVKVIATIGLIMFTIGLLTRVGLAIATGGIFFYVLYVLEGSGAHNWGAPFLVLMSLNLVKTWGDALSVDESIRRLRGRASPTRRVGTAYGIGIWLPGALWGIAFFAAAFAKVRNSGIDWGLGGAVQYHFVEDGLLAPTKLGLFIASHAWMASLFATGALAIEFSFLGHAFFKSPWVRLVFAGIAFGILTGFFLFQGVFWFTWWVLLLALLPWQQMWEALSGLVPRYVVLIDGACPMCRRTSRRLHAIDWLDRLEYADATDAEERARYAPGVSEDEALADMHVVRVRDGALFKGFAAYAQMARAVPFVWLLAPLAAFPPFAALGRAVYGRVAGARRREECTDSTCSLHGAERSGGRALPPSWRGGRAPSILAFGTPVIVFLTFVISEQAGVSWAGIEREPLLSNYPMYSYTSDSRADFDRRIRDISRFNDFRFTAIVDGRRRDVTARLATTGLQDLLEGELLPPGTTPDPRKLKAARANYEHTFGSPPPRQFDARRIRIVFDWDAGKFRRVPTPTLTRVAIDEPPAGGTQTASEGGGA